MTKIRRAIGPKRNVLRLLVQMLGWQTGLTAQRIKLESRARKSFVTNRERETGIEPASLAWEASALPLCYSRIEANYIQVN